jgi:hypothetical protein
MSTIHILAIGEQASPGLPTAFYVRTLFTFAVRPKADKNDYTGRPSVATTSPAGWALS